MKIKRHKLTTMIIALALTALLGLSSSAGAAQVNDAAALGGLTEGKGLFLVDIAEPQKTALYLKIIEGTHKSMAAQGVEPEFIVVYIGPTVRLLTKEPSPEFSENSDAMGSIAASVKALGELGVRQEICVIATDFFKVPADQLLAPLTLIGNGFNSLIGYQSKGFSLVPIY